MSAFRLDVELYHEDCPKVTVRGAPMPRLRADPPRTGVTPVFRCPRCEITISVVALTDVVRPAREVHRE